jgi:hypothetical protein
MIMKGLLPHGANPSPIMKPRHARRDREDPDGGSGHTLMKQPIAGDARVTGVSIAPWRGRQSDERAPPP